MSRIVWNKKILISCLILILFMFLGAIDRIKWIYYNINILESAQVPDDVSINAVQSIIEAKNGYDIFLNGIGMGNIPFIVIIASLIVGYLFAEKFAYFLSTGFGNMCIIRNNFKRYFLSDIKMICIKTFLLIFISEVIFLILCMIIFSANNPIEGYSNVNGILKDLYYEKPLIYCIFQILNQSLFFTILTLLGYGITAFIQNRIIISLTPFIMYMLITVLCQISNSTIGYYVCKLIYPDFILFPFMYANSGIHIILGYFIYFFVVTVLLTIMYKKFSKSYIR